MVALAIEFSCVVAWFLWLHRRQVRDRMRAQRLPWRQLKLELEEGAGMDDRRRFGSECFRSRFLVGSPDR